MGRTRGNGCILSLLLLLFEAIKKLVEVTVDYLENKSYTTIRNFNIFLLMVQIAALCVCIWLMYSIKWDQC